MTVTYSDKSFLALLFRWRGSVWKDILMAYGIFISLYFGINLIYRFGLSEEQMIEFEKFVRFFHQWNQLIPIQFLIGFYVSSVFGRWWDQLNYVAWPDKFLIFICGNIQGLDEESAHIRRTFARYANLLNVMVWKEISVKIKKRFPTDAHLHKAGLLKDDELEIYKQTSNPYGKWFVPVSWMVNLLARCKEEGRLSDYAFQKLLDELYAFSRQSILPRTEAEIDIVFPLFTTLEFIFYIGWMKVGEDLRCPFGEDDEDFDMNYVLDRNIHVSHMLVDELHQQRPSPQPMFATKSSESPHDLLMESTFANTSPSTEKTKGAPKAVMEPGMNSDFFQDIFDTPNPRVPHTKASWLVRDAVPNWRLYKYKIQPKDMEPWEEALIEAQAEDQARKRHSALVKIEGSPQKEEETTKLNVPNNADAENA